MIEYIKNTCIIIVCKIQNLNYFFTIKDFAQKSSIIIISLNNLYLNVIIFNCLEIMIKLQLIKNVFYFKINITKLDCVTIH